MAVARLEPITSIPTKVGAESPDSSMSSMPVDGFERAIRAGVGYAMSPAAQSATQGGATPPVNGQTVLGALVVALVVGGLWMSSVVTDARSIATEAQRAGGETDRRIREVEGKVGSIEDKVETIGDKISAVEVNLKGVDEKQDRMVMDLRRIQESLEYLRPHQ